MPLDPVLRGQLLVRRAGQMLRRSPDDARRVHAHDEEQRAAEYERGERAFTQMAERLERLTGCQIDGRRALDYGCGVGRLALPLARRCEHLHGLDISPEVLAEADRNAKRLGLTNVEWSDASRLPELRGSYDLVISMYVFQHIPSREGERIFSTIVGGLAPGGIGAIHLMLRPGRTGSGGRPGDGANGGTRGGGGIHWGYPYMLVHSYSLNRIARLLADEGITEWHAKWHQTEGRRSNATVVVFFRKD